MSARKEADRAAERARALCHELYTPASPQDLYGVVASLVDAQRSLAQACRMIADHLDRADDADYRDDRYDAVDESMAGITLANAALYARHGRLADAQNELCHIGAAR